MKPLFKVDRVAELAWSVSGYLQCFGHPLHCKKVTDHAHKYMPIDTPDSQLHCLLYGTSRGLIG